MENAAVHSVCSKQSKETSVSEVIKTREEETEPEVEVCIYGQIVHRRRLSSKLLFYDLLVQPPPSDAPPPPEGVQIWNVQGCGGEKEGVELMVKAQGKARGRMPPDKVQEVRLNMKLGDVVCARGVRDVCLSSGAPVLHCSQVTLLVAWADVRPHGAQFVPQPHTTWRKASSSAKWVDPDTTEMEDHHQKQVAEGATDPLGTTQETPPHITPDMSTSSTSAGPPDTTSTSRPASTTTRLCKFFSNNGKCFYGDNCRYLHSTFTTAEGGGEGGPAVRARDVWVSNRLEQRRLAAQDKGDPHAGSSHAKTHRARVFVTWLVNTFGVEALSQGTGVIDVAGGRGSVSFELWTRRGIPCTLIDPRPLRFTKEQHKWLKGTGAEVGVARARGAAHQLMRPFGPELWQQQQQQQQEEEEDTTTLLRSCSVVIGMHPDQATEAIVDFALAFNKPFAVIPCCVFPRLFPNRFVLQKPNDSATRPPPPPSTPPPVLFSPDMTLNPAAPPHPPHLASQLPNSTFPTLSPPSSSSDELDKEKEKMQPVVVHEQLVRYLAHKSEADVMFLPFEGSNQVVFRKTGIREAHVFDPDPNVSCLGNCTLPDMLADSGFGAGILSWIGL